jgi:hypothetical protein
MQAQGFEDWCANPDNQEPAVKMALIDDFFRATMSMHNE